MIGEAWSEPHDWSSMIETSDRCRMNEEGMREGLQAMPITAALEGVHEEHVVGYAAPIVRLRPRTSRHALHVGPVRARLAEDAVSMASYRSRRTDHAVAIGPFAR